MSIQVSKSAPLYTRVGNKYMAANIRQARRTRRFNVPILTTAALTFGLSKPISIVAKHGFQRGGMWAARELLANYTGVWVHPDGTNFRAYRLLRGFVPLALVMLMNRSGIFRPVNTKLANARIPLRLS